MHDAVEITDEDVMNAAAILMAAGADFEALQGVMGGMGFDIELDEADMGWVH